MSEINSAVRDLKEMFQPWVPDVIMEYISVVIKMLGIVFKLNTISG